MAIKLSSAICLIVVKLNAIHVAWYVLVFCFSVVWVGGFSTETQTNQIVWFDPAVNSAL